jgi:hypothetical protein
MTRPQSTAADERLIEAAEERVREQEARLRSMIVQGAPTQAAEDLLRQLHATLRQMKARRRLLRTSQRKPSLRPRGRRDPGPPR